ncbi:MKI67 FHA domain-interacting nucleolar phosphoprotein [Quillaja saponaria]|uniref:MKI67 FHA domain-interacting nucleolar phosphoprotein n=1 Tax=Quillaja saponaria TaxID=32244 RepID=A0AAD7KSZ9_QUISA|nr:MKI67 FHA domain-interacting nucleolar phosphoprotein [Quillaja saponaria]
MGIKEKKALKKATSKRTGSSSKTEGADFLSLEGGPGHKLPVEKTWENTARVCYGGRIPHGFYEKEMEEFFKQFACLLSVVNGILLGFSSKTGNSKHFGFIEFESSEVAQVVADFMNII